MITHVKMLFFSQVKNANLSRKFLVSYDVTSLFTNNPLEEAIDIAINLIFNSNLNMNITKYKKRKKLFPFPRLQRGFIFSKKICNQVDRVALGSPLDRLSTDVFMVFL